MANKYDATALAANAQQLEALARSARANMLSRTTEKATRLGADGERLARQAKATEAQRADADALAKSLLAEAAKYEAKANTFEQQAAAADARHDPAGSHEATELREEAAKQRQGAEVARSRSRIAAEDAKRLADEASDMRIREQAIDAELADMGGRLPMAELAVDNLEWHAERARTMADTVRQADDLQQQATVATARGDSAAAATLTQRAAILRDDADVLAFVRARPPFVLDERALAEVGVTLAPGTLDVPMPELIDPNSPMNPLAATSPTDDGEAVALAPADLTTDEMIGFDMSGGDSHVVVPDESSDSQTEAAASGDTSTGDSSFGDPSFGDTAFDQPAFDPPVFDEPMADTALTQSDFGDLAESTHEAGFDDSVFDRDAGFAEPLA